MAKVMSVIGVPIVLAPVFGPTLGGLLLQSVGWQWIFLINVPIGALALVLALRLLPHDESGTTQAGRLDFMGLALAAPGVVGITYGLSESETAGSLTASSVLLPVLAGLRPAGAVRHSLPPDRAPAARSQAVFQSPPSGRPRSPPSAWARLCSAR